MKPDEQTNPRQPFTEEDRELVEALRSALGRYGERGILPTQLMILRLAAYVEELEARLARVDPTKVIGICRNPGEPFFWDAERIGEPCPDADCSRNAEDAGLEPPRHGYYVLASTTEAPDDE